MKEQGKGEDLWSNTSPGLLVGRVKAGDSHGFEVQTLDLGKANIP